MISGMESLHRAEADWQQAWTKWPGTYLLILMPLLRGILWVIGIDRSQVTHSSCVVDLTVTDLSCLDTWAAEEVDPAVADLPRLAFWATVEAAVERRGGILVSFWSKEQNQMSRVEFGSIGWYLHIFGFEACCTIEASHHCTENPSQLWMNTIISHQPVSDNVYIYSENWHGLQTALCKPSQKNVSNPSQKCRSPLCFLYVVNPGLHNISDQQQEYMAQFEVTNTTHPTRWRMLQTMESGEKQELIMRVQGILTRKELPPIQVQ
jgi:hypothetical protein